MEIAIYNDCVTLVNLFESSTQTPDFEMFCQNWKTTTFYHIYTAQTTNVELIQTTRILLQVAKRIVCGKCYNADWSDEERTILQRSAGVFLMYAVYFKQPTKEYVKIEVSLSTWKCLLQFVQNLPLKEWYDDVRYTFWRLYEADAFAFTALDYCVGLEGLADYDKLFHEYDVEQMHRNDMTVLNEMSEYTSIRSLLPSLTIMEDGYNEMKEILTKSEPAGTSAQALPSSCIFKQVQKTLEQVEMLLKAPKSHENVATESTRRKLKRKGFKTNPNDDIQLSAVASASNIRPRQSVKTIFAEPLPLETLIDLEDGVDKSAPDDDDDADDDCGHDNVNFEITEYLDEVSNEIGDDGKMGKYTSSKQPN